jgi:hypothetical protein
MDIFRDRQRLADLDRAVAARAAVEEARAARGRGGGRCHGRRVRGGRR